MKKPDKYTFKSFFDSMLPLKRRNINFAFEITISILRSSGLGLPGVQYKHNTCRLLCDISLYKLLFHRKLKFVESIR